MRYIKQEGIRDCGVCCLFNIIRYYGGYVDIEKIRQLTNTNENGTSIYNLVDTANKIGFKSKAYKCNSINDLNSLTFPLILYIKLNEYNHFVILDKIDIDKISIFDPIRGKIEYSYNDFNNIWQKIIITFEKNGNIIKERNYYNQYLISIIYKYKNHIIIILVLSVICTILSIFLSLYIKNIFDSKIKSNSFIIILFLTSIRCVFEYLKNNISISLNNNLDYSLSSEIYKKLFSLPTIYHHSRPVGDITSKINDIYSLENLFNIVIISSIIDFLTIIFILFTSLIINYRFFIVIIFLSFFLILIYYISRLDERSLLIETKEKKSINDSNFIENLVGIDTINNLNISDKVIFNLNKKKKEFLNSYSKYIHFISFHNLKFNFIESYGIYIVLLIGLSLFNKNKISIGDLSMLYSLLIIYFNSVKNIITLDKSYLDSKISFKRINSLLNVKKTNSNKKSIKNIESIKFDNVSYSLNNYKIFSKFNLDIKKGDYVLINGRSGVGKSTLFKLLTKQLELKEGNILINDDSINNISDNSIRKNICYVSQDEYIFTDSIKNNILMFKNYKKNEIEKVLRVTLLDKVLKRRNISLDYLLEENGHNISAGTL